MQKMKEVEDRCILALGLGGSALQAIAEEIGRLKFLVVLRIVSSVSPQLVPGEDSVEALLAAGGTWGTRITTQLSSLT